MVTVNSSEFGLTGGILCLLRQENLLFSFFPAECTKVQKYCFGQTKKCWVKGTRLRYFFVILIIFVWTRAGFKVSSFDSGSSRADLSPGRGHYSMFFGNNISLSQCLSPPRCMG